MRAVIYARYSSDLQREASIEDQLSLCAERAKREGWTVVGNYSDRTASGADILNRGGIKALLTDAKSGKFEIVVSEALDRISRDQEDIAAIYKRLCHYETTIFGCSERVFAAGPAASVDASHLVSRRAAFHMATKLYANWMARGSSFAASALSRSPKRPLYAEFSWSTRTENLLAKLQLISTLTASPRPAEASGMPLQSTGIAADATASCRTRSTGGSSSIIESEC